MKRTIICIGRQFGSGGHEIGKLISAKLNIPFYDKEIINEMVKESGYSKDLLDEYDERSTNSFLYSLSLGAFSLGGSTSANYVLPLTDKIFMVLSDTIKNIAKNGSCVLVGRCADEILSDDPDVFKVFIFNDLNNRIGRIASIQNISRSEAESLIKKTDKSRANYHNFYSDKKWGEAINYDICINSKIGIEKTADVIISALEK